MSKGNPEVKMVEIECEIRMTTALAIKIFDGKREAWIPKSQIDDEVEEKGVITAIFIPEYLALEKGLI